MADTSPPLQQRSRATMEAISEATMQLLETHTFEELTIGQIVKAADSSTGSFYARFKGKTALLHFLHEEYAETAHASIKLFVEANGPGPLSIATFAERMVPLMILSHFESHGLLRAVTTKSFQDTQFARRAVELLRWTAMNLSPIVENRAGDRAQHIASIEHSLLDVTAILDRDLFYHTKGRPHILTAEKKRRLERVMAASLAAGQTSPDPKTDRKAN